MHPPSCFVNFSKATSCLSVRSHTIRGAYCSISGWNSSEFIVLSATKDRHVAWQYSLIERMNVSDLAWPTGC